MDFLFVCRVEKEEGQPLFGKKRKLYTEYSRRHQVVKPYPHFLVYLLPTFPSLTPQTHYSVAFMPIHPLKCGTSPSCFSGFFVNKHHHQKKISLEIFDNTKHYCTPHPSPNPLNSRFVYIFFSLAYGEIYSSCFKY